MTDAELEGRLAAMEATIGYRLREAGIQAFGSSWPRQIENNIQYCLMEISAKVSPEAVPAAEEGLRRIFGLAGLDRLI